MKITFGDPLSGMEPPVNIDCFIEGQEIRGVMYPTPQGALPGFQFRLRYRFGATADQGERIENSPWIFATTQAVEVMLQQWQAVIAQGQQAPPGTLLT